MTEPTPRELDATLCAVTGCPNPGRAQRCPYDGRYHWHGSIHYTNNHPAHPALRFRDLADGGWRGICDPHATYINAAVNTHRARLAAERITP